MTGQGNCWHCGQELADNDYSRKEVCPQCRRDTRVCLNCGFHDRAFNNECKETQADRVVEKEKSNFCDYFQPKTQTAAKANNDAQAAAEALFKK